MSSPLAVRSALADEEEYRLYFWQELVEKDSGRIPRQEIQPGVTVCSSGLLLAQLRLESGCSIVIFGVPPFSFGIAKSLAHSKVMSWCWWRDVFCYPNHACNQTPSSSQDACRLTRFALSLSLP